MRKVLEGSVAVAQAVNACRPHVISAYPITPQTHIVESLAQMVADGECQAQFVNVESEFSAASVCLGASATGARSYSATTSQGLLLMNEVLYNIAGMRLPVMITCVNRAVSAPLNIWNDQQDSISVRDSGWIQLYAENNQDAMDLHVQAFRIAEDHRVLLPVMVCMDGFVLSHTFEPVEPLLQEEVDAFLPPRDALFTLDPQDPRTFGMYAGPDCYMEARYMMEEAMQRAKEVVEETAREFYGRFGRFTGGLVEGYRLKDAEVALVSLGSVVETIKEAVDAAREEGIRVGVLKLRCYRPFPLERVREALAHVPRIGVLEKCISLGALSPVCADVRAALQGLPGDRRVSGITAGLGGRDIPTDSILALIRRIRHEAVELEYLDLNRELLPEVSS